MFGLKPMKMPYSSCDLIKFIYGIQIFLIYDIAESINYYRKYDGTAKLFIKSFGNISFHYLSNFNSTINPSGRSPLPPPLLPHPEITEGIDKD